MSDQADQVSEDRIKPWTIKGISPEARNAAIAAAERARQPIGEWVSRAIRSYGIHTFDLRRWPGSDALWQV